MARKNYERKKLQAASYKPQAWQWVPDMIGWIYERYKKETSKTGEEIPAIPGSGDQRHANEGLQSFVVCCTTGPES